MPLFKNTLDTLKANGMMSHLELALQHFRPRDMSQCEHHLRGAQKALMKVKSAKAEYILADAGWEHVARLAKQLQGQLLEHGLAQLAQSAREIGHSACLILVDRENPTSDSEFAILGPVDEDGFLIQPPPAPRIMRDPFPVPSSGAPSEAVATHTERDISPRPACIERDWVGDIVGLLMGALQDYGVAGMEKWTILIIADGSPALLCGLPSSSEVSRYCILGDCEKLQHVVEFYPKFGPLTEPAVQDLAFEICRRAEPQWDTIVERYHEELGKWYSEQPPLS